MIHPSRVRGMALILALFIAALAAVVAITLVSNETRWLSSVEARRNFAQAKAITEAGVTFAAHLLHEDARKSQADHLLEDWAFALPPTPIEYGSVEGYIVDLTGRINVNNLMPTSALRQVERARLERLALLLNTDPATLTPLFARFVDPDERQTSAPARKTSVQPLFDASEIATLLPGTTFKKLSPYLVALPNPTPVNVNTAPREVLQASLPDLSDSALTALIEKRPFQTLAAFRRALPISSRRAVNEAAFSVSSRFFLVTVRAEQNKARSEAQALLQREGKHYPKILWKIVE